MNASSRARYFHKMNRLRQNQDKESNDQNTEKKKPNQKFISAYFKPKSSQEGAKDSVSPVTRTKPCESTLKHLNSFSVNENEDSETQIDIQNSPPDRQTFSSRCDRKRGHQKIESKNEQNSESEEGEPEIKIKPRKATPLEEQVIELKSKHPGVILMLECGYRYRFFGEDAYIAAKVLDIMVNKDAEALFATASVPTLNGANSYIRKLVSAGNKVGIVSQLETSAQKKVVDGKVGSSVFQRDLTSLYTAATLMGDDIKLTDVDKDAPLGVRQTIVAILEEKIGSDFRTNLVSIQPLTGEVVFDEAIPSKMMEHRLSVLQPMEILISDSNDDLSSGQREIVLRYVQECQSFSRIPVRLESIPKDQFSAENFQKVLSEQDTENSDSVILRQLWPGFGGGLTRCFGTLYNYLSQFNLEKSLLFTPTITSFESSQRRRFMYLPSLTIKNLEIFESATTKSQQGSIFQALNCTKTRFGARLFRDWMSHPLTDPSEIDSRLDVVQYFSALFKNDFHGYSDVLHKVPDLHSVLMAGITKKLRPSDFASLVSNVVRVNQKLKKILNDSTEEESKNRPYLLNQILRSTVDSFSELDQLVEPVDMKSAMSNNYETLLTDFSPFPGVTQHLSSIEQFSNQLTEHKSDICKALALFSFNYSSVAGTDYLVEVSPPGRKVPADWQRVNATKSCVRYRTPVILNLLPKLQFAQECLIRECQKAWLSFIGSKLRVFRSFLVGLKGLAQLDCLLSLGHVARRDGFCRPVVSENDDRVHVMESRNIIVQQFSPAGSQYVANSIEFGDDKKALLLTGPNMGGKSCYMRQVAMISLLAQIGSFVPASVAHLPIFDAIFLRIGARDNLWAGKSTLAIELDEAGLILRQATSRSLVLLDELGRGTSTYDGVAIAAAVLKHLVERIQCKTILVTHYLKLTENTSLVNNFHMGYQADDEENEVVFLYKLRPGPTQSSFGLNVAKMAGIPQKIITLAEKIAKHFENKDIV